MPYVLNLAYFFLLALAAPWFLYQRIVRKKYRQGFAAKFFGAAPQRNSDRPCIWFHAVSVGEVNLLAVLLNELTTGRPEVDCVISTTTMTGYELATKKYAGHSVFYCPLDFSWAVRRVVRRIRPSLLVLAELELWPNLIRAARQGGAKVAIVNGRLSEKSFRGYLRLRRLLQSTFERIDLVAVQNEEYAARFRALGFDQTRVQVTGSLKFDGAQTDRNNAKTQSLRQLAGISADDIVFLAGSTQAPEEQLALETFQALAEKHPRLRLVIVPRHPHRFDEVAGLLNQCGFLWQRRSELRQMQNGEWGIGNGEERGRADEKVVANTPAKNSPLHPFTTPHSHRILLVDTIGELGAWWGTATVGFVGGSLFSSRGGQNMIEPAAYGVATCFGPNTQNFRDVVELLLAGNAALKVTSGAALTAFVSRCIEQPSFAATLSQNAAAIVRAHQGGTARTLQLLDALLPDSSFQPVVSKQRSAA